jgi:predicted nuclease of predicted toxin-antitoxin system
MRFKIDENIPTEGKDILLRHGYPCDSVYDENLQGCSDETVYSACTEQKRVLVTLDFDFADIRRYPPAEGPGCLVLTLGAQSKAAVLKALEKAIDLLRKERVEGALWIISTDKIRIRT